MNPNDPGFFDREILRLADSLQNHASSTPERASDARGGRVATRCGGQPALA
jgi:hypothetical protein